MNMGRSKQSSVLLASKVLIVTADLKGIILNQR
jgi:hypothetical protein